MKPLILFAHGAGAGHTHPWMQRWYLMLHEIGEIHRLTYPYIERKARLPDKMPVLEAAHLKAATDLTTAHPNRPLLLIGKSMGEPLDCNLVEIFG